MKIDVCDERSELMRQINAALSELSKNSKEAHVLVSQRSVDGKDKLIALQKAHILLEERIRVLRECLKLHRDMHKC